MFGECVFRIALAGLCVAIASIAASAEAGCKMLQIAQLPVRIEHGAIVVGAAINGASVDAMIDTGAEKSLIFRSAATKLGLTTRWASGRSFLGVGGESAAETAFIDELRIGDAALKRRTMFVAGEQSRRDNVAIILGEDFFRQVDVEFDLAHGAVRLFQPKDCGAAPLAYWATETASQIEIDRFDDSHPSIVLPIQIGGRPVRALLDSGAAISVLDTPEAARLGVTPETPGVVAASKLAGLGNKLVDYSIASFDSVAIGNETIKDAKIPFGNLWKDADDAAYTAGGRIRNPKPHPGMLLGADFLRTHRVLVAHSQGKVYFTYVGGSLF